MNPKDRVAGQEARVPIGLVPDTAIIAIATALSEGAAKYGRHNWRVEPINASVYHDALRRHLAAWWNGEDTDADSGLPHLWKALACLAILVDATACGTGADDRPPAGPVSAMLAALPEKIRSLQERHADRAPRHFTIADKAS